MTTNDLLEKHGATMTASAPAVAHPVPPPSKHQLAAMIWLAVFPTLTLLNLLLGDLLGPLPVVGRTLILVTIAVPVVVYAAMPGLHRVRRAVILRRRDAETRAPR